LPCDSRSPCDLHTTAVRELNRNVYEIICGAWSNQQAKGVAWMAEPAAIFQGGTRFLHVNVETTKNPGVGT
jgi:hypothetical protein